MALTRSSNRTTRTTHTTTTTTSQPSLLGKLTGGRKRTTTRTTKPTTSRRTGAGVHKTHGTGTHAHGTHAAHGATHHQQRRPGIGDKVSGALMKVKGSLTGRSGQKAAGTRRMHGTDGKGSHRVY